MRLPGHICDAVLRRCAGACERCSARGRIHFFNTAPLLKPTARTVLGLCGICFKRAAENR